MVEIVAPYWTTDGVLTGDWVDLADFDVQSFATGGFGQPLEGSDFEEVLLFKVYGVTYAALANTVVPGYRLQLREDPSYDYGTLLVVDAAGNVVDYMTHTNGPSADYVTIPSTGVDHYVIIGTDTGLARVKKWLDVAEPEIEKIAYFQSALGSEDLIINRFLDEAGIEQVLDEYFLKADGTTQLIFFVGAIPTWPDEAAVVVLSGIRYFEATDRRIFEATDIRIFEA